MYLIIKENGNMFQIGNLSDNELDANKLGVITIVDMEDATILEQHGGWEEIPIVE